MAKQKLEERDDDALADEEEWTEETSEDLSPDEQTNDAVEDSPADETPSSESDRLDDDEPDDSYFPTRELEGPGAKMETQNESLRAMIRLIPPARSLKERLEESLHLETYAGTGDMAVRSYQGLHGSVALLTDEPYVDALSLTVPGNATPKEKISLALLAASQLLSYLEGQTGFIGGGEAGGGSVISTAPFANATISNVGSEALQKMIDASQAGNAARISVED